MEAPFLHHLILSILLFTCIFPPQATSQTTSANGDARILLQVKQDWDNQLELSSWNVSATPNHCQWLGVQCAADNASVVGISLPSLGISGAIPVSVCDLGNLSYLDVSNNYIPGTFPTALYNCTKLEHLNISYNFFVGSVPPDVDRLSSSLVELDLSGNNFTGDVPASLGKLSALRELALYNNLFNGSFPAELGNLTNLELLFLAYNPFAPTRIPPEFGNLSKLTTLWMRMANLEGDMPSSFAKLASLQVLDLSENSLTGVIPAGIWALENLQFLYLYENNLTGPINIQGTIGALALVNIDISKNQLNGSFPEEFGKLQNLSKLAMYENQFTGIIPASIGLLPSLTDFRVFNNQLSGILPPELGKHSPLGNIEVSNNMISGELPQFLCASGKLTSIVVSNNNMSGMIPASVGDCTTLNNFQIENNRFSGDFPRGIWLAVNMTTMLMRNNSLTGAIPDQLPWNLTRVEIQNNRFSGSVPSTANNLRVLLANNNELSGELPTNFSGLSLLQSLSLGSNLITGNISVDISMLRSVTDLNLSNNQLSGGIPMTIGSLPVLTSLDLSANELSGAIPTEMGNLKLNFLDLSSNHLTGEIPSALQAPPYSQSFLSNPSLCAPSNSVLNVSICRHDTGSSSGLPNGVRIFLIILIVLVFLAVVVAAFYVIRIYRRRRNHGDAGAWKLIHFQPLDITESAISRGLTDDNVIGSGRSGKVYKIAVRSGVVAVKKIPNDKESCANLEKEFESEVQILASIRHVNIVKLLCCAVTPEAKLLVYEYMENGSLDRWLQQSRRRRLGAVMAGVPVVGPVSSRDPPMLNWPKRLRIAIDVARGLCYMHQDFSPPIVHRDIKSSNILLDSGFRARIADFGLARTLLKPREPNTVSVVAGSIGYMAPECAYSRVNEKADVYSFGVVLLELTTGREASDGGRAHAGLAEWAWKHLQDGNNLANALDSEIREPSNVDEMADMFKLGVICTGTLPSTRPSMKEVLQILLRFDRSKEDEKPQLTENDVVPLLNKNLGSRQKKQFDVAEAGDVGQLVSNV